MNALTALVFILALGSLNGLDENEIDKLCMKKEGLTKKDFEKPDALEEMKVKCFYHCQLEKQGIIANGKYAGKNKFCENVKDDNKCELGKKVLTCHNMRT